MRWLFIKEAEQGIYGGSRYYSLRQASSKEMTGELVATKVFLTTDILSVTTGYQIRTSQRLAGSTTMEH
jgi:hypothetical protein